MELQNYWQFIHKSTDHCLLLSKTNFQECLLWCSDWNKSMFWITSWSSLSLQLLFTFRFSTAPIHWNQIELLGYVSSFRMSWSNVVKCFYIFRFVKVVNSKTSWMSLLDFYKASTILPFPMSTGSGCWVSLFWSEDSLP